MVHYVFQASPLFEIYTSTNHLKEGLGVCNVVSGIVTIPKELKIGKAVVSIPRTHSVFKVNHMANYNVVENPQKQNPWVISTDRTGVWQPRSVTFILECLDIQPSLKGSFVVKSGSFPRVLGRFSKW